jgi:hypothetical protein
MRLQKATVERQRQRVQDLSARFQECHEAFLTSELFSGPSLHFHRRTIGRLRSHATARAVFDDDQYFECLYATLTAWGLHRMGPGNAKLTDFQTFKANSRSLFEGLASFFGRSILTLTDQGVTEVCAAVGRAIEDQTGLTRAKSVLVANTKAVHHFLPDLVPPIDRSYTLWFFFERTDAPGPAKDVFGCIFERFTEIARQHASFICNVAADAPSAPSAGAWDSGHAKVLDNALVGWVRRNRKAGR